MPSQRLGRSDIRVGRIAYGCSRLAWDPRVATARAKIGAALDLGMNLIDTADVYGGEFGRCEELLGAAMTAPLRDRMVLATKFGVVAGGGRYDNSGSYATAACTASLRRLAVDHIDLYQVHRPDPLAHPEPLAGALARLRGDGKIREVGVSNFTVAQVEALQAYLPFPIATIQPKLSLTRLDALRDGMLDHCTRTGVTPLAWGPLDGGRLVADPAGADVPAPLRAALAELAGRHEVGPAAIALAFLLALPAGVIPIVGTQDRTRLAGLAAAARVELAAADCYQLMTAAGMTFP
jgi:aryl-alcohol dehydrogenase-like predicted oxidoreductase